MDELDIDFLMNIELKLKKNDSRMVQSTDWWQRWQFL